MCMSDCCSTSNCETNPRKLPCPACSAAGAEIAARTLRLHIRVPWLWSASAGRYFFCEQPDCAVVYFGDDGSLIRKADLRARVGVKEADRDAPLCYCYGVSRADVEREPALRDFVVAATRDGQCACDTRNPSGRCCLKDFPKPKE
jgi:hypothetical protein